VRKSEKEACEHVRKQEARVKEADRAGSRFKLTTSSNTCQNKDNDHNDDRGCNGPSRFHRCVKSIIVEDIIIIKQTVVVVVSPAPVEVDPANIDVKTTACVQVFDFV
jgi:hypothetical protein